jgi:hypothetical protein
MYDYRPGEYRSAIISPCGLYRYRLIRRWGNGRLLVWIMLNPSTADAEIDDPTIRRVRHFTKRERYGGFVVVNIWALRATDPADLHTRRAAFEPENIDRVWREVWGRDVVAAWGANVSRGPGLQRVRLALRVARSVQCLGLTKAGHPRHPLMLRNDTQFIWWHG